MIGLRLYGAPLPGGVALVATPSALDDLRRVSHVLAAHPQAVSVDVLLPGELLPSLTGSGWHSAAVDVAMLAASRATLPQLERSGAGKPAGPHGRWYGALVAWGWLLLLAAGQSTSQMLGGVWLVAALPWLRRAANRTRWGGQEAVWLGRCLRGAAVIPLDHAGLSQLQAALQPADTMESAARRLSALCSAAGVPGLAPWYDAIASGSLPPGIWSVLRREAPSSEKSESTASEVAVGDGRGLL